MKVLVTGATGFLGTTLCRRLREAGADVVGLGSGDADLTRPESLLRFGQQSFDRIYHLAAWTQAGDFCLTHPGEQWLINQQINTQVLSWWAAAQPQAKLTAIGTSCAYDPAVESLERNYLAGDPIESLFTYAMTKRMLYVGLLALQRQFGLEYLYVVPSTLYGPGYHADGRQMHFIFDLIRKILAGRREGRQVVLWGDGYQKRELIYIDDFVDALLQLSDCCTNEVVNIGAGIEYSIREFAGLICQLTGYDPAAIRYDVERYVGARSKVLRIDKLESLLPSRPRTDVAEGLGRTLAWFEEHWAAIAAAYPG